MLHESAAKQAKDLASDRKAKPGIKLFWLYGLIYMGFVGMVSSLGIILSIPLSFITLLVVCLMTQHENDKLNSQE